MIYPEQFSVSQAHAEGWDLTIDDEGRYAIEAGDEIVALVNRGSDVGFATDAEAVAFVRKQAKRGSAFHIYALSLHGSPLPPDELAEWKASDPLADEQADTAGDLVEPPLQTRAAE